MLVPVTQNQLLLLQTVSVLRKSYDRPVTVQEVIAHTPALTLEAINEAIESSPELAKALDGILVRGSEGNV